MIYYHLIRYTGVGHLDISGYFPFWDKLTDAQRRTLAEAASARSFKKGAMLHQGAGDCTGLLIVVSGSLRVYTVSDEGKELTLYRLFDRDVCLFSASCIMRGVEFEVMVSAALDSEVIVIPSDVYKKLMNESAAVANYTNELTSSHFSDVMWLMDQILSKRLDSRLAAFLVEESALSGLDTLLVTHEQIAGNLGSLREVITRMLKYFQAEGLVKLSRGTIALTDKKRLEALAEPSLR